MGYIYKITNDINNKVYIGQTIRSLSQRWSEHKHSACHLKNNSNYLYNAMNCYGIEHFKIELIEECENSLLNNREKYWIQYFDSLYNGYNATPGGESCPPSRSKPVDQIDINTNQVIHTFKNAREVERELGIANQYVSDACNYKKSIVNGYKWEFHNLEDKNKAKEKFSQKKRQQNYVSSQVYCKELNKFFKNISEAALYIKSYLNLENTNIHTIYNSIRRSIIKGIHSYGYTWERRNN